MSPNADEATYVATHWSDDGVLPSCEEFDSLHDAQTHVDTESFGSLDPAVSPGAAPFEWGRVVRLRDWESAAQLLAPEYRARSDQFLSGGQVTGKQLLAWFAVDAGHQHSRELIATELHAASPVGIVHSETDYYVDGAGSSFESGGAALIAVRDGLLTSADKRDDDKLPDLLDVLDRLAAEAGEQVAYLSETARALRSGRRSSADR